MFSVSPETVRIWFTSTCFFFVCFNHHSGASVYLFVDKDECSRILSNEIPSGSIETYIIKRKTVSKDDKDVRLICEWIFYTPSYLDRLNLILEQLKSGSGSAFTLNMTPKVDNLFLGTPGDYGGRVVPSPVVFDKEELQNKRVYVVAFTHIKVRFEGNVKTTASVLVISASVIHGRYRSLLPHNVTDGSGYVFSPGFDDFLNYPSVYEGYYNLTIADNESLVINFLKFYLTSKCKDTFLLVTETVNNTETKMCGCQAIPMKVVRSSVNLFFQVGKYHSLTERGFKMLFTVVPRTEEPKPSTGNSNLWDCSVPYFKTFEPLLRCNLLTECEGGEDEKDCDYHGDCRNDLIDGGSKCYQLVRPVLGRISWSNARRNCYRTGMKLATFGTSEEFKVFKKLLSPAKDAGDVFVGTQLVVRLDAAVTDSLYRYVWQWVDKRSAFSIHIASIHKAYPPKCAYYRDRFLKLTAETCFTPKMANFVCEFEKDGPGSGEASSVRESKSLLGNPGSLSWNVSVVQCPSGHVSRDFLSCDSESDCAGGDMSSCSAGDVTVPMYRCQETHHAVHYSLLCDHVQHCPDNTDEDFCDYPSCPANSVACQNGQCLRKNQVCDGRLECNDGSDEACIFQRNFDQSSSPPGALYLDGKGTYYVEPLNESDPCPKTHFLCPGDFCLPVFLLCNGIADCPGREDETKCDSYTCPDFYRCWGSRVCLHTDHMCDGVPQCPQLDDELLCALTCPDVCRCQGLAYVCTETFSSRDYPDFRYLDASGSKTKLSDVNGSVYLVRLRLSSCQIRSMPLNVVLPNLRELDLSWNKMTHLDMQGFQSLTNLRVLTLSGNPLTQLKKADYLGLPAVKLEDLDMTYTSLAVLDGSALAVFPDLKFLNMSSSKLNTITKKGFKATSQLKSLDLRGCDLKNFPSDLLRDLSLLETVYADNYKLCCQAMLPAGFDMENCHAEKSVLASCRDLLKSNTYRVFLWLISSLSIVGNVGSIVTRLYLHRGAETAGSFSVFVTNLSIADLLMGVYLAIIGGADFVYYGIYLWHDIQWRHSTSCSFAGFLCMLSNEVSAFIICLITLDRFIVLRFPLSGFHLRRDSAVLACLAVWLAGLTLAAIPLLPGTSHWEFYSQTGICMPLPFTRGENFPGYWYSIGVTIVLNFILFVLIAVGQVAIYKSVRLSSTSTVRVSSKASTCVNQSPSADSDIARRLTAVVVTDFLCWFPIGLLGLLAATGIPMRGEVSVAVAIFVLPFNSALNPFLYTFNVVMEKRRKAREERMLTRIESRQRSSRKLTQASGTAPAVQQLQELDEQLDDLEPSEKTRVIQELGKCLFRQIASLEHVEKVIAVLKVEEWCDDQIKSFERVENSAAFQGTGSGMVARQSVLNLE